MAARLCRGLAVSLWVVWGHCAWAEKLVEDSQRTVTGESSSGEISTSDTPSARPAIAGTPQLYAPGHDITRAQVLLGTTLGIFWHEFGHALIGETGLPATGPEEDVADGFSAFVLTASVEEGRITPEQQAFMAGVVRYSALLWYHVAAERRQAGGTQPWQDEHAPDMKRFRNAFCIIYGSNPARHAALADDVGLSARTRERCRMEYAKRYRAWETILRTVARDSGAIGAGASAADLPGGRILLEFRATSSVPGNAVVRLLNGTGLMTHMMTEMEQLVVWPRDLDIVFRDCARPNAWYDQRAGSVTICYSLIEQLSALVFRAEGRGWDG